MKDRKKFRERIDGEPQPEHLGVVTEPCSQFIQLYMWEPQMAEAAFVQELRRNPPSNPKSSPPAKSAKRATYSPQRSCHVTLE
jgi:hypothetical protein